MTAAILPLLTEAQVADLLGLSIRTLQAWRQDGKGPPYVSLAEDGKRGTIRYRQQDILSFIEGCASITPHQVPALARLDQLGGVPNRSFLSLGK